MSSKQARTSKTARGRPARRSPSGLPSPPAPSKLHEQIATRAYAHYDRRIRQGPIDDWLQAEQEILGLQNTMKADLPHRGREASEK
jgi:hypothetical protein